MVETTDLINLNSPVSLGLKIDGASLSISLKSKKWSSINHELEDVSMVTLYPLQDLADALKPYLEGGGGLSQNPSQNQN